MFLWRNSPVEKVYVWGIWLSRKHPARSYKLLEQARVKKTSCEQNSLLQGGARLLCWGQRRKAPPLVPEIRKKGLALSDCLLLCCHVSFGRISWGTSRGAKPTCGSQQARQLAYTLAPWPGTLSCTTTYKQTNKQKKMILGPEASTYVWDQRQSGVGDRCEGRNRP